MTIAERHQRWKFVLTIITVAALLLLMYVTRRQVGETISNLSRVNAWVLLAIIPCQLLSYHAQTRLYQSFFAILDEPVDYSFMYKTALSLNFVNTVFPSAAVSGFSYFSLRLRSKGITTGQATLVQLMRFIMVFASFQILLLLGLLVLAIGGRASNLTVLVSGSLATLLVVLTLGLGFIIGSKDRINRFFTFITQVINRIIHVVRPKHPETINVAKVREIFTELHENYLRIKSNYQALKRPLVFALIANLAEVMTIYSVYIAFGHWVNPGAVIIAYAIANFAGLISVLPGGVGIYEALMTAILATAGVPAGVSLPVTVMYRVLNMSLQLLPGYFFYHQAVQNGVSPRE